MKNKLQILTIFLTFCASIITAIVFHEGTFLWILTLFAVVGFIYKETARNVYLMAFCVNIIFGCILIWVFQSETATFFDVGGDDTKYFNYFNLAANGNDVYLRVRYGNFIFLGSSFIKFLGFLGIEDVSPLLLYPLNWLYGANACALTYILAMQLGLSKKGAYISATFLSIYPFFVLHETKLLREMLVTLLTVLFFVTYFSKIRLPVKLAIYLAIFLVLSKLRGEFILYLVSFFGIDFLFDLYAKKQKMMVFVILLVGGVCLFVGYSTFLSLIGRDSQEINRYSEAYAELRSSTNTDASLGASLKNAGGLFTIVTWFYIWLSPFPPPVFLKFNLIYVLISVGAILWYKSYLKFPFILYSYLGQGELNSPMRKNVVKFLLFIGFCSGIIAMTTADSRHLISFYPLIFIIFYKVDSEYPESKSKLLNNVTWILAILMFVMYGVLKLS